MFAAVLCETADQADKAVHVMQPPPHSLPHGRAQDDGLHHAISEDDRPDKDRPSAFGAPKTTKTQESRILVLRPKTSGLPQTIVCKIHGFISLCMFGPLALRVQVLTLCFY